MASSFLRKSRKISKKIVCCHTSTRFLCPKNRYLKPLKKLNFLSFSDETAQDVCTNSILDSHMNTKISRSVIPCTTVRTPKIYKIFCLKFQSFLELIQQNDLTSAISKQYILNVMIDLVCSALHTNPHT